MFQTIIAKNEDMQDEFCLGIIVETLQDDNLDIVVALHESAQEFIRTEAGQKVLEETNGHFNWGDLVENISDEICERHGVRIVDTFKTDLVVPHDEQLVS